MARPPEEPLDARVNGVLGAISQTELDRVCEAAEEVHCDVRDQVYTSGKPIEWVHFPLDSVFSMVAPVQEDTYVEVGTIGREAFVGVPAFLGATTSPHETFCQVPGLSVRLSVPDFRRLAEDDTELRHVLQRSLQATMVQLAQNAACNLAHPATQRASRWLLMTHDRVMRDTFPLTQEFLAQMLGVRRATVTDIARELQRADLIRSRRGQITIADRAGLERVSCECYGIVRREFDTLVQ